MLAAMVLLANGCANAPAVPGPDEIEAQVRVRSEALATREKAGEWDAAAAFFAADAVMQGANAPQVAGRAAILEAYRSFPPGVEFEGTSTAIVPAAGGDMAYEYGVNRFVVETPEGQVVSVGKYLAVWRNIDGEWLVSALAFSDDAPPPPR